MNVADLIPVLRALHADPTSALVFSDWFEERGEPRVGEMLRGFTRSHTALAKWHSRRMIEMLTYSTYWESEERHRILEQALIKECEERVRWDDEDVAAAENGLLYLHPMVGRKSSRSEWHRLYGVWDKHRYLLMNFSGTVEEIDLHKVVVVFDPPSAGATLCGGWLTYRTCFWVGRRANSEWVVTSFSPKHTEFVHYNTIPF
jgi:uncharacterized protein (TIGR02996 family)